MPMSRPGSRPFLPCLDVTRDEAKRLVRLWATYACQLTVSLGITEGQFRHQVTPLVSQLPASDRDEARAMRGTDLPHRKRVAATDRLGVNTTKIVRHRAKRRRLGAESLQLWVMHVAVRATPQHRLRQERFPPQGHKPTSVEVLRMHRPEPHVSIHSSSQEFAAEAQTIQ